ncbi:MAG: DUF554 domain-containing protein [Oscillospiraceae bacterium]|nr:DUF554 domain-containing protein [Oscillospiraceae bacterium]
MTGATINALAILAGGGVGLLLRGKLTDKLSTGIIRAIGLCIIVIGVSGALEGDIMLMVVSLALGTLIGELLRIEGGLNNLGLRLQKKMSAGDENTSFAEGFVTATLLFCVGAMAIVGSIDSGLRGDHSIIITKSILDAVAALLLASTFGVGVLFSAVAVFFYQGSIELFAGNLQGVLTPALTAQISAVGGVMILAIGLNMTLNAKIKTANLLPGFLFAVGYYILFVRG